MGGSFPMGVWFAFDIVMQDFILEWVDQFRASFIVGTHLSFCARHAIVKDLRLLIGSFRIYKFCSVSKPKKRNRVAFNDL